MWGGGGGGAVGVERLYAAGLIGAFKYVTDRRYIMLSFSNLVTFNFYFIFTWINVAVVLKGRMWMAENPYALGLIGGFN